MTAKTVRSRLAALALAMACLIGVPGSTPAEEADWLTGMPRQPIHVAAWPGGRKVAVCFVLYVETWGYGHGPTFRTDMAGRDPDVVNEAFRRYAIAWGLPRVARLFRDESLPLSLALSAEFPRAFPEVWSTLHALVPTASIVAHGINNSTDQLPLGRGLDQQRAYIRRTLDLIEQDAGLRPRGWSSPSVYPNGDTFRASAAEGITYTLDGMDSDTLTLLSTQAGPLVLVPYPPVTVDMGQFLQRNRDARDLERLWTDYVGELVREAQDDPGREATVVAIGIHPFVVGTPDGAAALRRVLEALKQERLVWVTDIGSVLMAATAGSHPTQ
jgi:peptidoglycan/xylan/chitin deacetylase (PgdA/CDA1 family)